MSAGVLNLEIDQGATFEKRMYFLTKKIVTAIVDPTYTSPIGSTRIVFAPGGFGQVKNGDFLLVMNSAGEYESYKLDVPFFDLVDYIQLQEGGNVDTLTPLRQVIQGNEVIIASPMNLTNSTFTSQIRTSADSPDVVAQIECTLALDPLEGYYDLFLDDATTSAIPTVGKTDYTKKARFTCDGELRIGGRVVRSYNGTVYVSPETTKEVI